MPQRIYTATLRLSFATKNENKKRLKRGVCWKPPGARGRRVWFRSSRERTGVDGIEADRVDQAEHDFHALRIISGNGEADSIGAASRDPARAKAAGGNVVERIVGISRGCGKIGRAHV